jgi:hypothetical protein
MIVARIAASFFGGYAFTWGFVSLGIVLLVTAGMPYREAQTAMFLLAFLVFLAVFCWSYAAASVRRLWLVLAGGGGFMTAGAWLVSRSLL